MPTDTPSCFSNSSGVDVHSEDTSPALLGPESGMHDAGAALSQPCFLELFDRDWYLATNPDVAIAGHDPLGHYLSDGAAEGRDPHPLFDTSWYLEHNPDVAAAGRNPLAHYLSDGAAEGRDPHPLFDLVWYDSTYAEALTRAEVDPLSHYLSEIGRSLGTNPNRYFDRDWYLAAYPEATSTDIDPLVHYLKIGASEGKDPSPRFQTSFYATANPDVIEAGFNPLVHFLLAGEAEGREPRDPRGAMSPASIATISYADWLSRSQMSGARACLQRRLSANFETKPLISLIVPVYKVGATVFEALISSVHAQTYPFWELCIAIAYFDDKALLETIERAATADRRIKVVRLPENRGISHNSNDALALATGTFIALLDHDDALPPDALFEMAQAIEHEDGDLFYSDKDAISEDGNRHFNPLFKAAWSPETMLSANYLTHLNVIRRSYLERIGGWDPATDGAQDWDIFLRIAAAGARIRHVPKILYHWRHVETSVAANGLAAKPYAANGQLATLRRWMHSQGWLAAEAAFTPEGYIRVRWGEEWNPSVGVVLFGMGGSEAGWRRRLDAGRLGPLTEVRQAGGTLKDLYETIAATNAEIIVIVPAAMSPLTTDWLAELVAPLENSDIAAVSGKVLDPDGRILDAGWIFSEREWRPIFRGAEPYAYSAFGSAHWFRNYGAASLNGTAFRRADFLQIGDLGSNPRPDLEISQKLRLGTGERPEPRILYNPFATSVLPSEHTFEQWCGTLARASDDEESAISGPAQSDPYFNTNLILGDNGVPVLRPPLVVTRAPSHDYEAEAAYFGNTLDFTLSALENKAAALARAPGPLRIGWVVPHFRMPFYGGLMTILRCADHLRREGVVPVFIGLDTDRAASLRKSIALAFPDLASAAEIHPVRADQDVNALDMEPLDGAICTLWTTAFILQKMTKVQQKFYFVQDYEPLFYPAGTTSSLVEATYRFGFHGICNTEPLKTLYENFGAKADFFNPAVDTDIFHPRGRVEKNQDDPVTIFSYARPGHPRNCFELLAPALAEVKLRFGEAIQIFTAGADWYPADYGLAGAVEHLGLMPYSATGELYRGCDIGVVAMATCHPSYLPFELMATGAVVCTNFNRHTGWLLRHRQNCYLFDMAKTSVVDGLSTLISDADLRRKLSANGIETIRHDYSSWDASCARVHSIILNQLGN